MSSRHDRFSVFFFSLSVHIIIIIIYYLLLRRQDAKLQDARATDFSADAYKKNSHGGGYYSSGNYL